MFNAQGSRVIIVVVLVGAMKIYVAVVEELRRKKKDRMKPSLSPIIIKIGGKTSLGLTDLFGFETHLRV